MKNKDFYASQSMESKIKSEIVSEYFGVWTKIIWGDRFKKTKRMGYIDIFCGPGIYKDGSESTPLLILKTIAENEDFRENTTVVLNDENKEHVETLKKIVKEKFGDYLKTEFYNMEVNDELRKEIFNDSAIIPSLIFIDPWGYKGLTKELLIDSIKSRKCDVFLFFNYNRIKLSSFNPIVEKHMIRLFGEANFNILKENLGKTKDMSVTLDLMLSALHTALSNAGIKHIVPYKFLMPAKGEEIQPSIFEPTNRRLSHALLFITKNDKAAEALKNIFRRHTLPIEHIEYGYFPNYENTHLYEGDTVLSCVIKYMLEKYSKKTVNCGDLKADLTCQSEFWATSDITKVLRLLEKENKISVDMKDRRKGTFAEHLSITFLV
jgi:three-Cys-motif partner protein